MKNPETNDHSNDELEDTLVGAYEEYCEKGRVENFRCPRCKSLIEFKQMSETFLKGQCRLFDVSMKGI